jgi:hypothetical protein
MPAAVVASGGSELTTLQMVVVSIVVLVVWSVLNLFRIDKVRASAWDGVRDE